MTTSPLPQTPLDVSPPGSVTWPAGPPGAPAGPPRADDQRRLGIPVLPPDRISPGLRQRAGFAAATGVILCVLSTVAAGVFAETDRTVFLGLSAGIVFVVKGFVDLRVADHAVWG